jgi:hypothetical protein
MKKNSKKEESKKSFINAEKIEKVKNEASAIVKEIKNLISVMGFMDWFFLILALTFGLSTIADLFGANGNAFVKAGEKIVKNFKAVGFWKAMGLLILIVFATDKAIKLVSKYKMIDKTNETKEEETK